jgi:hypothetical protein
LCNRGAKGKLASRRCYSELVKGNLAASKVRSTGASPNSRSCELAAVRELVDHTIRPAAALPLTALQYLVAAVKHSDQCLGLSIPAVSHR